MRHIRDERRVQRSDDPAEAVQRWLDAAARRCGARALSVSTPEGIPIAQSGTVDPRKLVIAARLASRGARVASHEELPGVDGQAFRFAGGLEVLVGSCGTYVPSDAEFHLRRILS